MVFSNNLLLGASSNSATVYDIPYGCRFDGASELSLTYTLNAPWTFSAWVRRCELSAVNILLGTSGSSPEVQFNSGDTILAEALTTTAVFRDPTSWTHIHISNNGLYVNGVSYGAVTTTNLSNAKLFDDFDGYVADVHLQSGTRAYTSFGELDVSNNWVPVNTDAVAGEHFLKFGNSSILGENSGSGSDWTATGLASTDQVTDTPTNVYATWSSADKNSAITLADGNLVASGSGASDEAVVATLAFASGKRAACAKAGSAGALRFGVTSRSVWDADANSADLSGNAQARAFSLTSSTAWSVRAGGATALTGNLGFTFVAADDYVVVAFDVDAAKLWFGAYDASANTLYWYDSAGTGRTSDEPGLGTNATFSSITTTGGLTLFTEPQVSCTLFTGATVWPITSPSGFSQMCTDNIAAPAIPDGSAHHQSTLYTGNGSTLTVTQSGNSTFTPDAIFGKQRNGTQEPWVFDVLRGTTKYLLTNGTAGEATQSGITAFNSNGFDLGSWAVPNQNTFTNVAWQWKAGGAGVSNTNGTITSTVSANPTAGFSIVKWTGTGVDGTIGHGLSTPPRWIEVKRYDATGGDWRVFHYDLAALNSGNNDYALKLNATTAAAEVTDIWDGTAPTSSVFSVGNDDVNVSGGTFVAYCWADVPGYCKIGYYKGNGSTDGKSVYTGFKPAYVEVKISSSTGSWVIIDSARATYNPRDAAVFADQTTAETTGYTIDILSNGFKIRTTDANLNTSGATYLYKAIAERPVGGVGVAPAKAA